MNGRNIILSQISIEELTEIVNQAVERCFTDHKLSRGNEPETDRWFNLTELCQYHPDKPAKQTVYGWISHDIIPSHKTGKKRRFRKSEIDEWLKEGKNSTVRDILTQADKVTGLYQTGHRKKLINKLN